ncbi:MAG: lytic transglycosylase domain-containing protein [Burkholderiaceae bacterium]
MKALNLQAVFNQGPKLNILANVKTAVRDTADGFFEIFHNGFAVIGLTAAILALVLLGRPDLRYAGETKLLSWLQVRHTVFTTGASAPEEEEEVAVADLDASERATATDPADLPKQQAAVAYWLSKKYKVAPEPLSALVAEAYAVGAKAKLEPTLILAIMAIESGFNPFAQSPVGAQGLMQVMTKIHSDKYEDFGGKLAAFDPITNLRVGVKVLQGCIAQAGSIEGGLKYYVGAANLADDGGYASKVVAEYARLYQVAYGKVAPQRKPTPNPEPTMIRAKAPTVDTQPVLLPVMAPAKSTVEASVEKIAAL